MSQLQRLAIAPEQRTGNHLSLTPNQQHYLTRVLRLRSGDRFIAIDGTGHWWLTELSSDLAEAQILEAIAAQTELPMAITLLIAMPKGNGMDEIVRQGTEIGVTTIVPVISDRTLLNPSAQKLDRWQRIAQEAAEQAERQVIPQISSPISFTTAIAHDATPETIYYIAEARGDYPHLLTCLTPITRSSARLSSIVIAIGPEGGWTESELNQAIAQGYQPVSLGQRVLRAITAPLVALSLIAAIVESMSE